MIERIGIEESKAIWFNNDLTVCTIDMGDQVWALPQVEVTRGNKYLLKLKSCRTLDDAQKLFEVYATDKSAPKFLPLLFDLKSQESNLQMAFDEAYGSEAWTNAYVNNDELPDLNTIWENIKDKEFSFEESPFFRDQDNDVIAIYGRPQLWTDEWMPLEIVNKIGVRDNGYGIDYIPAEYVFPSQTDFTDAFESFGFRVVLNDPRLRMISGY